MGKSTAALIGISEAVRSLRKEVAAAGASGARVLITGDTGTGKEVVAQMLHSQSGRRARRPLMSLNCAGLPETLLESELFGHERGSFTGADRARAGILGNADGGTVFLDEVGELSLRMQSLLLRFLDNGEIQRVGARGPERVDVRVIAATNVDLATSVATRTFRQDLFYRLNVLRLQTTALRHRREDIPVLFAHFLGVYAGHQSTRVPVVSRGALGKLIQHDWPGNVRELRNMAERLVAAGRTRPVEPEDISRNLALAFPRVDGRAPGAACPGDGTSDALFRRMIAEGESFWSVVHAPFMARDLTRRDLRAVVTLGLKATCGNYKSVICLFNMKDGDYRRFLGFLGKHDCLVNYRDFRTS